jgi:hypothetical protein
MYNVATPQASTFCLHMKVNLDYSFSGHADYVKGSVARSLSNIIHFF